MVGIVSVSARIIRAPDVVCGVGGLVHDFVIDTLFGSEGLQSWMWVFVLLLGAESRL